MENLLKLLDEKSKTSKNIENLHREFGENLQWKREIFRFRQLNAKILQWAANTTHEEHIEASKILIEEFNYNPEMLDLLTIYKGRITRL